MREVLESPEKRKAILESDYARAAMTGKEKILQEDEAVFRPLFRKSLVAGQSVPSGTVLAKEMVYAMRPQGYIKGMPSEEYERVIGKIVTRDMEKYEPITEDMIKAS